MPREEARELLIACCGAAAWVAAVLAARPFRSRDRLMAAADRAWTALTAEQLAEAKSRAPAALGARERAWSAGEQSGAQAAEGSTRAELARGNEEYERRFGHPFILCATGLSGAEMLRALRERLGNDPERERAVTSRELQRITRLRLEKLLADD